MSEPDVNALLEEIEFLKSRVKQLKKSAMPCSKHAKKYFTIYQVAKAAGVAASTVYRHLEEGLLDHDVVIVKRGKPQIAFYNSTMSSYVAYVAKYRLPKRLGRMEIVASYADEYGVDAAAERFGMKRRSVQMAVYRQNKARKIPEIVTPTL
jgi:predicted DNA-binding transcriptional regulator AlpA